MEKGVWPSSCRFAAAQNGDLALVASATPKKRTSGFGLTATLTFDL